MGRNWDKPFTREEFDIVWYGSKVRGKGTFQEYHGLSLGWGETHKLLGEPEKSSGPETAWPKYVRYCQVANSPLGKALE